MSLENRLSFSLRERGTLWDVQYTTRAGNLIPLCAVPDANGEIPQDVMTCLRAMILAGERSSNTLIIERRISEIYHTAGVEQRRRLQDLEALVAQQG